MNGLVFKSPKAFKEDILIPLLNPETDEYQPYHHTLKMIELTPEIPGY
jgi:hypothetical protein